MSPEHQCKLSLWYPTRQILDLERFEEIQVLNFQVDNGEQLL